MPTVDRLSDSKEKITDQRYPGLSLFLSDVLGKEGSSYFSFQLSNGGSGNLSVRRHILQCRGEEDQDAFIAEVSFNNRFLRVECHVNKIGNIVVTKAKTKGGLDLLEKLVPRCEPADGGESVVADEPTVIIEITDSIKRVLGVD